MQITNPTKLKSINSTLHIFSLLPITIEAINNALKKQLEHLDLVNISRSICGTRQTRNALAGESHEYLQAIAPALKDLSLTSKITKIEQTKNQDTIAITIHFAPDTTETYTKSIQLTIPVEDGKTGDEETQATINFENHPDKLQQITSTEEEDKWEIQEIKHEDINFMEHFETQLKEIQASEKWQQRFNDFPIENLWHLSIRQLHHQHGPWHYGYQFTSGIVNMWHKYFTGQITKDLDLTTAQGLTIVNMWHKYFTGQITKDLDLATAQDLTQAYNNLRNAAITLTPTTPEEQEQQIAWEDHKPQEFLKGFNQKIFHRSTQKNTQIEKLINEDENLKLEKDEINKIYRIVPNINRYQNNIAEQYQKLTEIEFQKFLDSTNKPNTTDQEKYQATATLLAKLPLLHPVTHANFRTIIGLHQLITDLLKLPSSVIAHIDVIHQTDIKGIIQHLKDGEISPTMEQKSRPTITKQKNKNEETEIINAQITQANTQELNTVPKLIATLTPLEHQLSPKTKAQLNQLKKITQTPFKDLRINWSNNTAPDIHLPTNTITLNPNDEKNIIQQLIHEITHTKDIKGVKGQKNQKKHHHPLHPTRTKLKNQYLEIQPQIETIFNLPPKPKKQGVKGGLTEIIAMVATEPDKYEKLLNEDETTKPFSKDLKAYIQALWTPETWKDFKLPEGGAYKNKTKYMGWYEEYQKQQAQIKAKQKFPDTLQQVIEKLDETEREELKMYAAQSLWLAVNQLDLYWIEKGDVHKQSTDNIVEQTVWIDNMNNFKVFSPNQGTFSGTFKLPDDKIDTLSVTIQKKEENITLNLTDSDVIAAFKYKGEASEHQKKIIFKTLVLAENHTVVNKNTTIKLDKKNPKLKPMIDTFNEIFKRKEKPDSDTAEQEWEIDSNAYFTWIYLVFGEHLTIFLTFEKLTKSKTANIDWKKHGREVSSFFTNHNVWLTSSSFRRNFQIDHLIDEFEITSLNSFTAWLPENERKELLTEILTTHSEEITQNLIKQIGSKVKEKSTQETKLDLIKPTLNHFNQSFNVESLITEHGIITTKPEQQLKEHWQQQLTHFQTKEGKPLMTETQINQMMQHLIHFPNTWPIITDQTPEQTISAFATMALFGFILNNEYKFFNYVLELKPDLNSRLVDDKDDTTLLIAAIKSGRSKLVKILVEKGADINQPLLCGTTPLRTAYNNKDTTMIRALLELTSQTQRRNTKKNSNRTNGYKTFIIPTSKR